MEQAKTKASQDLVLKMTELKDDLRAREVAQENLKQSLSQVRDAHIRRLRGSYPLAGRGSEGPESLTPPGSKRPGPIIRMSRVWMSQQELAHRRHGPSDTSGGVYAARLGVCRQP